MISNLVIIPIIFIASGVLWFILYPLYAKWYTQKNIPRIIRSQMRPSSTSKHKLEATTEELEQISEAGESKVKWNVVDNVIKNSEHTFISIEGNLVIIIPRHKMEKNSYEEFMNTFRRYQSNRPILVNKPHA